MIVVLVALIGLIAVSSFAIDVGLIWGARTQLQNAADSAALAGAANLLNDTGDVVTVTNMKNASISLAANNRATSNVSLELAADDVEPGNWDIDTEVFDPDVSLLDPGNVNAVRVTMRMDGISNGPLPAYFSRIVGKTSFDIGASAVAYVGYAGGIGPGEVELPIAVPCCKLKGADCDADYCETIAANPPNPCDLDDNQDPDDEPGAPKTTCMVFHATEEQNACWTNMTSTDSSLAASELKQIVRDGNLYEVNGYTPVFLDNGSKANVIRELKQKFYGEGYHSGNPAGMDRYPPFMDPPVSDSWVTSLPVVECQDDDNCAGGGTAVVKGFVCIEIREIEESPLKLIRMRFLCPSDPLFKEECDIGPSTTGGLDFGLRADIPVLVQ